MPFFRSQKVTLNVDYSFNYLLLLLLRHSTLVFLTTRKFKLFHFFQHNNFQIFSISQRRQNHRLKYLSVKRRNIKKNFLFILLLLFFTQHWLENWSFWQLQLLACWLLSAWVRECVRVWEIGARISSLFNAKTLY